MVGTKTLNPLSSRWADLPPFSREVLRNLLLVFTLVVLVLVGFPVSIPAGFILSLSIGYFLSHLTLGDNRWDLRSADGLLIGFSESFMFSVILLSPLAYIVPFLLGQVSFLFLVSGIALLLGLLLAYKRRHNDVQIPDTDAIHKVSGFTPHVTITLWFGIAIIDLLSSIHMFYGSFDGLFFMFADLTNQLNLIQGIGTGMFPQPNFTFFESSLAENPVALTLSLGYSGVMISTLNLQAIGDIFVIVMKMFVHSTLVPLLYYVARGVSSRIPAWAIIVSVLGLGVGMDLVPLQQFEGSYIGELNRGILFPWDRPDQIASDFFAPGLGAESTLSSFHHLLPILVFFFIIGLLLRTEDWMSSSFIIAFIASLQLLLYHIGIDFFLIAGIALTILGTVVFVLFTIERFEYKLILYKIAVMAALLSLFLLRGLFSSFVLITSRFTGNAILESIVGYLGLFSLLGAVGYLLVYRLPESFGKWASIVTFDLVLLEVILFSTARDSGIGIVPTDYFPLFNLQAIVIVVFLIAFSFHGENPITLNTIQEKAGPLNSAVRKMASIQIPSKLRSDSFRAIRITIVILLCTISGLQLNSFFNENLGEFNENFYGSVPTVNMEERAMFKWIRDNSDVTDVILSDPENWELAAIIGRQILYSGYRSPTTEDSRYQAYVEMYNSTTMSDSLDLFLEYDISLIVVSPIERINFPIGVLKFLSSPYVELAYSEGVYAVYQFLPEVV
ncbi:MAG: hypothetical protein ACXAAR_00630 [Candidatus Thorarchaeota archaeon]